MKKKLPECAFRKDNGENIICNNPKVANAQSVLNKDPQTPSGRFVFCDDGEFLELNDGPTLPVFNVLLITRGKCKKCISAAGSYPTREPRDVVIKFLHEKGSFQLFQALSTMPTEEDLSYTKGESDLYQRLLDQVKSSVDSGELVPERSKSGSYAEILLTARIHEELSETEAGIFTLLNKVAGIRRQMRGELKTIEELRKYVSEEITWWYKTCHDLGMTTVPEKWTEKIMEDLFAQIGFVLNESTHAVRLQTIELCEEMGLTKLADKLRKVAAN